MNALLPPSASVPLSLYLSSKPQYIAGQSYFQPIYLPEKKFKFCLYKPLHTCVVLLNVLNTYTGITMDSFKDCFTIREASKTLGVCQATLRRWDKLGKLKAIRHPINGYRLYKKDELRDLVQQATSTD